LKKIVGRAADLKSIEKCSVVPELRVNLISSKKWWRPKLPTQSSSPNNGRLPYGTP
jgi:hypothetical protein